MEQFFKFFPHFKYDVLQKDSYISSLTNSLVFKCNHITKNSNLFGSGTGSDPRNLEVLQIILAIRLKHNNSHKHKFLSCVNTINPKLCL